MAFDPSAFDPTAFDTASAASAVTRTLFRNALFELLADQQTATPNLLRDVLRFRPGGMGGEKPKAWVGQIRQNLTYDAGTRNHTMQAEVIVAATYPSDVITDADPYDELLDALVERFTDNAAMIERTILELTDIDDGDIPFQRADGGSDFYRGATLTIQLRIWEGRQ